ncbi:MAG TPA: glutamate racemase [Clostridia bacterium]|nr:glutamate racemase [Clostridia bacterium]
MTATKPMAMSIGLFDSGIGGLTVAKEVLDNMPCEGIVYFGDTANVPYGSKSPGQLRRYAREIIDFLVTRGVKYIIFACNTSSSVSLDYVKQFYRIPMIGVVLPGSKAAVNVSSNCKIGVIATEATTKSRAYELAIRALAGKQGKGAMQVYGVAAPKLVPLVESGQLEGQKTEEVLEEYLTPLKEKGIDTLVLGCTHYPFLLKPIQAILGSGVTVIDPARLTVQEAYGEMQRLGVLNNCRERPMHEYWVSGDASAFKEEAQKFLGANSLTVNSVDLKMIR